MNNLGGYMRQLIIFVLLGLFVLLVATSCVRDNRGFTEDRAYEGVERFIKQNNIDVKRKTCAGDSDEDGYGTCTIVATDREIITIQCPVNWIDINIWGAKSCKEVPVLRMQVK